MRVNTPARSTAGFPTLTSVCARWVRLALLVHGRRITGEDRTQNIMQGAGWQRSRAPHS
jgi:hypothetical protein